jgi:hypothetical protein
MLRHHLLDSHINGILAESFISKVMTEIRLLDICNTMANVTRHCLTFLLMYKLVAIYLIMNFQVLNETIDLRCKCETKTSVDFMSRSPGAVRISSGDKSPRTSSGVVGLGLRDLSSKVIRGNNHLLKMTSGVESSINNKAILVTRVGRRTLTIEELMSGKGLEMKARRQDFMVAMGTEKLILTIETQSLGNVIGGKDLGSSHRLLNNKVDIGIVGCRLKVEMSSLTIGGTRLLGFVGREMN